MSKDAIIIFSLVLCATLVTLAVVFILFRKVSKIKIDSEKIEDIAGYIHSGAIAFLKREFKIIIPFILVLAVVISITIYNNRAANKIKKSRGRIWKKYIYYWLILFYY